MLVSEDSLKSLDRIDTAIVVPQQELTRFAGLLTEPLNSDAQSKAQQLSFSKATVLLRDQGISVALHLAKQLPGHIDGSVMASGIVGALQSGVLLSVIARDISLDEVTVLPEGQALVADLNRRFARTLLSRFVITLEDQFQGLLASASPIPDPLWHLEEQFPERELRVGIGFGVLHAPSHKYAINVDGPALHSARTAIETAKWKKLLGGVFNGFGKLDDVLNGLARILWFHRSRLTDQQRKILELLHQGLSQAEIAKQLRVSPQNISKHVASAGWPLIRRLKSPGA